MIDKSALDFDKLNGLIPTIIIDNSTGQVLMLGFMNSESYDKTVESKQVTFFSRSRNELWTKGETSGNYLNLVDIKADCDNDTLLVYADPTGPTCHTGDYSCFGFKKNTADLEFLNELFALIKERKDKLPEGSYTTKLFNIGADRIIQKVGDYVIRFKIF